ncbi:hypothetical protein D3C79_634890 [compost metagenome]
MSETAVELRGAEPELHRHGHADIPSRVKAVVQELAGRDALLRELADAPPAAMEFRLQQKVKAALSASAPVEHDEQHQGEPVGMFYLDHEGLWSEVKNPEWTGPPLVPLYTHADPGEVERHIARRMELAEQITEMYRQIKTLRTEKAEQHERFVAIGTLCDDTLDKYGQLQAKLAERDALLARSAKLARGMVSHPWAVEFARLAADIEQIGVSASAEPKAKPGVLEIEDCTFDNRPIPSGYTLGVSAEPSAPAQEVKTFSYFVAQGEERAACPFCGGKVQAPVYAPGGHDPTFTITCNCGCKYGPDFTAEACERGWNRRAIEPEQKKVAIIWRDALQQCAELLGMQCGDDLSVVPERLKSKLATVQRDEWMEFEKRFGPGTWGHIDYANEQIGWKCRAALEKKS